MGLKFARNSKPTLYTLEEHYRINPALSRNVGGVAFRTGSGSIQIPSHSSLGGGEFTYEAWVRPRGTGGYIISRGDGNANGYQMRAVGFDTDNQRLFGSMYTGYQSLLLYSPNGSLLNNVWSHVAFVSKYGEHYLFINGIEAAKDLVVGAPGTGQDYYPTRIGGWMFTNSYSGPINADVDDVRVWRRARTHSEIQMNYDKLDLVDTTDLALRMTFDSGLLYYTGLAAGGNPIIEGNSTPPALITDVNELPTML